MKKRFILITLITIAAFLLLTACTQGNANEPEEAPAATEAPAEEEEPAAEPEEEMEEEEPEAEEPEAEEEMDGDFSAVLLPKFLGILVFD